MGLDTSARQRVQKAMRFVGIVRLSLRVSRKGENGVKLNLVQWVIEHCRLSSNMILKTYGSPFTF